MSKRTLNPFYLISDKTVTCDMDDKTFDGVACVSPTGRRGNNDEKEMSYHIRVNQRRAREMFGQSWAFDAGVDFQDFVKGLLFHEISHIKYDAFRHAPPVQNKLYATIFNILVDNQGEYSITRDFPAIVSYIRLVIATLRKSTDLQTRATSSSDMSRAELEQVAKNEMALYLLARFGVVDVDADMDFINFCFPLVLAATRGDITSVYQASIAIYEYMVTGLSRESIQQIMRCREVEQALSSEEIATLQQVASVVGSSAMKTIEAVKDGSFSIGQSNTKIATHDKESPFYRETVQKRLSSIQRIRSAVKRRVEDIRTFEAVEGDFNFSRQQAAYVASYTQDASLDYTYSKIIKPHMDIVVIRDVSVSTSSHSQAYAEGVVTLLASFTGIDGIRIAEIDFSDDAMVNLHFDQKLNESRIVPNVVGGTSIMPAYRELEKMNWHGKTRYCAVLTDGGLSDGHAAKAMEERLSKTHNIQFEKYHLADRNGNEGYERMYPGLIVTSFDTFDQDITTSIFNRLRRK
jgi:hypothetical protein